jgi:hypothetical protein
MSYPKVYLEWSILKNSQNVLSQKLLKVFYPNCSDL